MDQYRFCVVSDGRQCFADFDRDLLGDGYERGGYRCFGIGDGDGEPAPDLHGGSVPRHHQPGRIYDSYSELQSLGNVLHLERQQRFGFVGFERECFPDHRRDLYRDGNQRGWHRGGGFRFGDGEPASDLHARGLGEQHQPRWLHDSDGKLQSGGNIVHLDQHRLLRVGPQRQRLPGRRHHLLRYRHQRGGHGRCGVGDHHGEPASDLYFGRFTDHHQPG